MGARAAQRVANRNMGGQPSRPVLPSDADLAANAVFGARHQTFGESRRLGLGAIQQRMHLVHRNARVDAGAHPA